MTSLKISNLVRNQVPEFVREQHPKFVSFLEAYYEFLETQQGTTKNELDILKFKPRKLLNVKLLEY